jgi:hypothetical protein
VSLTANQSAPLVPPIAQGMPINHNETLLAPIARGLTANHSETLLAPAGLAPAVGAARA